MSSWSASNARSRSVALRVAPRGSGGQTAFKTRPIAAPSVVSPMYAVGNPQGLPCPIYRTESVGDVVTALEVLLGDCQVGDVRVLAGIHPDVDTATGQPLFFKNLGDDAPLH